MKATILFSRTCGASKINPQVLLFGVHDIHFDNRATHIFQFRHIFPLILEAGNSTNDQPNYDRLDLKLKIYCGLAKVKWRRQHGTIKFTADYMNSVLVEIWHSFKQQSDSVIIGALKK